jgi:hypothetical protein
MIRYLLSFTLVSVLHSAEPAVFIEMPWRYLLGAQQGDDWFTSEQAGKTLGQPRSYDLFDLGGKLGRVKTGAAAADLEVCPDVWMVPISPEPDPDQRSIGVSATWNPQPRVAKEGALTVEAYLKSTQQLLATHQMMKPVIKLRQHLRVDLDRDESEDVILTAEHYAEQDGDYAPHTIKAGDYSVVYVRYMVDGKLKTQELMGDFYPKAEEFSAPYCHRVSGLLDLDGDGKLEIIVHSAYYEGATTTIWKLQDGTYIKVLELACGV